jgi:phospholipid-translocating ATPase
MNGKRNMELHLKQKNEKEQEALEEEMEHGMTLLGATAIEDKLQVNVGRTLVQMQNANIRTWVLTGDKVGTAIQIGFTCELLQVSMFQISVEEEEIDKNGNITKRNSDQLLKVLTEGLKGANKQAKEDGTDLNYAIIIEGAALLSWGIGLDADQIKKLSAKQVEDNEKKQTEFMEIAKDAKAVLCCRVSPAQKGSLTKLVKEKLDKVVLGIGDGANDVGMILEAHIGVGVQGVEGSQAVNSADFAICQFQHLSNLVLVHGRWTYYRLTKAICYFFYKNVINVFTIMWYAVVTGFSGTLQYNDMVLCMYNLFFTSIPVMVFALLEQDVDYQTSLDTPNIYEPGQKSELLNYTVFFTWVGEAVYGATVIFLIPYLAMSVDDNGHTIDLTVVGLTMYTINVIAVTLRLALETQYITWIHHASYFGSILLWYIFMAVEFAIPTGTTIVTTGQLYWSSYNMWGTSYHWMALFLATWVVVLPAFTRNCYMQCFEPTKNEIARHKREFQRMEKAEENAKEAELETKDGGNKNWGVAANRLATGNDEVNPIHAQQGRVTKLDKKLRTAQATAKAVSLLVAQSKSYKARKGKERESQGESAVKGPV